MNDLTLAEEKVLRYIAEAILENEYPPSVRDIQAALGYRTTSVVKTYIDRLVDKGYLFKDGRKGRALSLTPATRNMFCGIPVLGTIAAGAPLLAVENLDGYLPFEIQTPGYDRSNLFALLVKGESMKDCGIRSGDYVIIDHRSNAEDGEIIAAMIDGEATVKAFYRRSGKVVLEPRNDEFSPIVCDKVDVIGKVIANIRLYH